MKDLGVWMFPGVSRVLFLLAIPFKLNAVFGPFFSNHMINVSRYKMLHAADTMAQKNHEYPGETAKPPSPSGVELTAYFTPDKKP